MGGSQSIEEQQQRQQRKIEREKEKEKAFKYKSQDMARKEYIKKQRRYGYIM